MTFTSVSQALLVVGNIPFALVGGIAALWMRGMNLNLSASVGFIALFGVAMLNGVVLVSSINGLLSAYVTTFFLTFSNPVTILSFVAIYAGWHVPSLHGHYFAAAVLTLGVFIGSALWWLAIFIGLTTFREKFDLRFLGWVHRVSGVVIAGFGIVVLLSLSPLHQSLRIQF